MYRNIVLAIVVCLVPGMAVPALLDSRPSTPPTTLQIYTPALPVEGVSYSFEIALTAQKGPRGVAVLRAAVTVTKTSESMTARWRDIVVMVSPEATQFVVGVDGRRFVLEGKYIEAPSFEGSTPREVLTSFGQMFTGGRIGIIATEGT